MRQYIFLITFALLLFTSFTSTQQDPEKAREILDSFSKTLQSYNSFKADFTRLLEEDRKIVASQKGSFLIAGNQFQLVFEGRVVTGDGEKVWAYMEEDQEMIIQSQAEFNEELSGEADLNPTKLYDLYKNDFKYKYVKKVNRDGIDLHVIDLLPIEADDKPYTKVRLEIELKSHHLRDYRVFYKDGSQIELKIMKIETNIDIEPSTFILDMKNYEGIDITDFRDDD